MAIALYLLAMGVGALGLAALKLRFDRVGTGLVALALLLALMAVVAGVIQAVPAIVH